MEIDNEQLKSLEDIVTVDENFIDYEFGDMYCKCSCGHDKLEVPGIQGIQIILPATNRDKIQLVCEKCGNTLTLYFKPAENIEELMEKRDKVMAAMDEVKEQLAELEVKEKENEKEIEPEESL
jgi:hypothetical protein